MSDKRQTTPLLRKSAALGRKVRTRCGGPGYAAVTDADGCASGRLAQPGGLVWPPVPGLGVSAVADPPLPGELLASWIATLRAFRIPRAKRPFSGDNGGRNGKGWAALIRKFRSKTERDIGVLGVARGADIQLARSHKNGHLQGWPKA